jgi:hypothetical protein
MKIAEKLPIPKITLIPITQTPTTGIPVLTSEPQPTISTIITALAWNTYSDTEFAFSIEYPPGYKVQKSYHGLGVSDISFINLDNNKVNYQMLIYPDSIGKLIGQDFDNLYSLPDDSTHLMNSEGGSQQQFTKIGNKTLNNRRAFEFSTASHPVKPDYEAEIGVYIDLGGSVLLISTTESNKSNLDRIISTFR